MGQPAHEPIDPWTAENPVPVHKQPFWADRETTVEISPRQDRLFEPPLREVGNIALRFATEQGTDQPEIFDTIQGEGRNIGSPVVFARLSGCNLQCSWCDTPYTWAFNDTLAARHDEGKTYKKEEEQVLVSVGDAIDYITGYPLKRLVVTGGEPMLQQKGIVELAKGLRGRHSDHWIEVETNGTIAPTADTLEAVDQFNVSPKLENSGNSEAKRRKDHAMRIFVESGKADFKFVVATTADMLEILELKDRYDIPPERVFLMPEGRTPEEVEDKQLELVEIAKQLNFNVTTRLHVLIWSARRGV